MKYGQDLGWQRGLGRACQGEKMAKQGSSGWNEDGWIVLTETEDLLWKAVGDKCGEAVLGRT